MKVCPRCKNTIVFDADYCPFDGDKLIELHKCPYCGTELQSTFRYCFKCGKPVNQEGKP